jgi:large repetitive protein
LKKNILFVLFHILSLLCVLANDQSGTEDDSTLFNRNNVGVFVPFGGPDTMPDCITGADTLRIVMSSTNLTCNSNLSGTATVQVIKGTPPYSYLWSNGQTTSTATGLNAGTPSVDVFDAAGNICNGSIAITEPATLSVLASPPPIPPSCFGDCNGIATATPNGGTGPFQYSWSTTPTQTTQTATGLCAGNYTVNVTDVNGCSKLKAITIVQPPLLVANGSSTSITCYNACNGTASVAPVGGTSPFTYAWLPGGATTTAISGLCPNTYSCTIKDAKNCTVTYITTIAQPTDITVTTTDIDLLCNGVCSGSATATVSGGIPNYTYSWSPGGYSTSAITGLCAGNYTLTLRDANACVKTRTVSITQPSAIIVSTSKTTINCFGQCTGTATVSATGGVNPYSYFWLPVGYTTTSVTGLCANTYTVNVTDVNSCTASGTVVITEPTLLTTTTSSTNVSCNGFCNGSVSTTPSGGTAPYFYAWSPGGCTTSSCSNLCVGNYSVTITDSKGCTTTSIAAVTAPNLLIPNVSSTAASCSGTCDGSVTASPTGGTTPYTYGWSNGCSTSTCSNLCAGTYTLTLRDNNGCVTTRTITVSQPIVLNASISSSSPNPLNCNGDCNGTAVVSVSGGNPVYSYSWTNGATTPSVTGLCAGVYSVSVTDTKGCKSSTSITFLQPSTLSVTATTSNPLCHNSCDGSIAANPGGGTPGYSFMWLPGGQTTSSIGSLCPGDYTVTATDKKGCTNTTTVTLTPPTVLTITAAATNNVSCSGMCDGSASVSVAGGTPNYSYLWSGGQTTSAVTGLCAGSYSVTVNDAHGCTAISVVSVTQPSILTSVISSTTSSCALCTGTADVSTTGGTAPYAFLWSPGGQTNATAVGLCVGTYTVHVQDSKGCTSSSIATITPMVTISVTVSGSTVSCPSMCDGIAVATPFGGTLPYSYSWSTSPIKTTASATGLCVGSYSITVNDANGCLATNTISLTNPPNLNVTMTGSAASCGVCNGTASANVTGGTGAYTYTWSGFPVQTTATATGLCGGDYTVTVSDANNCTFTNTITITLTPPISDNAVTTLSSCGGSTGAICVAPSGGVAPYTYQWLPGGGTSDCVAGLAAGIYTVTIRDNAGCSAVFQNTVGNIGAPTIAVGTANDPSCNADCNGVIGISVSGGVGAISYLWSPGGQTTDNLSGLCAGTYIVQVTDAQPCTDFATVVLTNPAAFTITPTIINVSCNGSNTGSICVSTSGGTSPYTYSWLPGGQTTSCLSALAAGTYSVVVKDAIGCDDTLAIPIAEPASLSLSITSTNISCNGKNDGTATVTVSGGSTPYTYSWSNGSPVPSIVGLTPGNYSVTVRDRNNCSATATVSIAEPALLTTTISSTGLSCNAICDGTASLMVSGGTVTYSYAWSPGGNTNSLISGLCPGNYVGTVTDFRGCISTKSVTITQPTALSATLSSVNTSCATSCDGMATVNVSGGTGAYTYLWSPGGQTTSSASGLCAGTYTATITDARGCISTQWISVGAPAALQANSTSTIPSCFGGCNASATSSPIGGNGGYIFTWNTSPVQTTSTATGLCSGTYSLTLSDAKGCSVVQTVLIGSPTLLSQSNAVSSSNCGVCDGAIAVIFSGGQSPYSIKWNTGATSPTITGLCAGVYVDTVSDAKGCISVDTIVVNDINGPLLAVSKTNVSCYNACNGTATVMATGSGPAWLYSWSPGNLTTASITGLCPNQYVVTVTDTLGCKTIGNTTLTQPTALVSNSSTTNATCVGICDGTAVVTVSGGVLPYTYSWSNGATTSSVSNLCAGGYTLTLTDANKCVLTHTLTISGTILISGTITSSNATCNLACNGSASVSVSGGSGTYSYAWMPGGNTTISVSGLCAGDYTVTSTDGIGCQNNSVVSITEPTALAQTTTLKNPTCNLACNGGISPLPTGGTPPYTYSWLPGGSTTSSLSALCAGTYSLAISDANNCSATNTFVLTNPSAITAVSTITDATCNNVCNGKIAITPSGGTGTTYTYVWMPGAQTNQNATGLCMGSYSITLTDSVGCSSTFTNTVGAGIIVQASAGNDITLCSGTNTTLTGTVVNASAIAWYQIANPNWIALSNTSTLVTSPIVNSTGFVIVAINGLCSDSDRVVVATYPIPVVDAGANAVLLPNTSVILNGSGAGTYLWAPSVGLTNTTIANPSASPSVTTTYTLTLTDANGCTAYDTVRVEVLSKVIIHDGISPNGDGLNDTWEIRNIELFPNALVEVYNRWGEKIFSTTQYAGNRWDGTYKGNNLPVGTYYYIINLNSATYPDPITGPITLLR